MPFDELFQSAKRPDSSDGTEAVPQGNSMKKKRNHRAVRKFAEPYCVTNSKEFRLKDVDPADTGEATSEDKPRAKELLETGIQALAELQDVLYAQDLEAKIHAETNGAVNQSLGQRIAQLRRSARSA